MGLIVLHHLAHEADVVIFGEIAILLQVGALVWWHCLYKVIDDLVGDKGVSQINFGHVWLRIISLICTILGEEPRRGISSTYLAIRDFSETLQDLLGGILIFHHADHKMDELLEADTGILS